MKCILVYTNTVIVTDECEFAIPQVSLFRGAVVTDVVINVDSKFCFRFTENKIMK